MFDIHAFFRLAIPVKPIRPEPNSHTAAGRGTEGKGSGTGIGSIVGSLSTMFGPTRISKYSAYANSGSISITGSIMAVALAK